jgi:hypothetical protein
MMGILFIFMIFLVSGSFQNRAADSTLIIQFRVYVHNEPFQLNKKYFNPFGETYEISRFRFYAGDIAPVYSDTRRKTNISKTYHLIDFSDSSSTRIEVPVSAGDCNGIQFLLGVDSVDQTRGAQTGALDPAKGMFWTWNSGYQSFKIEGTSAYSAQPAHMIAYHIGGYRYAYNTVWKIKLYSTNEEPFRITKENKIIVEVGVDLDYFFDGQTPLHIREIPSCTAPGDLARKISENFIGTFTGLTISSMP